MRFTHCITLGACLALSGAAGAQEQAQRPSASFGADDRGSLIGTGVSLLAWDTFTIGDDAFVEVFTAPVGSAAITGNIAAVGIGQEIEFVGGVVYVADRSLNVIHRVNPTTGALMGSVALAFPPEGNVITAMEYIEGLMYVCIGTAGIGDADTYFGTVNLGTGVISVIGDTGVDAPITGLAYPGTGQYVFGVSGGGSTPHLYAITAVATTTDIGPVTEAGGDAPAMTGLEFGADGRLYAVPNPQAVNAGDLYVISPETGAGLNLGATGVPGLVAITSPQGCNDADLAPSFGVLDFDDVLRFLTSFGAGCN